MPSWWNKLQKSVLRLIDEKKARYLDGNFTLDGIKFSLVRVDVSNQNINAEDIEPTEENPTPEAITITSLTMIYRTNGDVETNIVGDYFEQNFLDLFDKVTDRHETVEAARASQPELSVYRCVEPECWYAVMRFVRPSRVVKCGQSLD